MTRLLSGSPIDDTAALGLAREQLADAAWSALVDDGYRGVSVVDAEGRVSASNAAWLEVVGATGSAADSIRDVLPAAVADELVDAVGNALDSGEGKAVESIIDGARCVINIQPIDEGGEASKALVVWCRRSTGPAQTTPDEDPLDTLTARERDVLRLIGYGLSTADIARVLHRSVKTIEWHRVALGSKLGVTNRVELARIAIRAGVAGLGPLPEGIPSDGTENGTGNGNANGNGQITNGTNGTTTKSKRA